MSEHNLKTLVEVLKDLKDQGYKEDFNFRDGKLEALGSSSTYTSDQIAIKDEFRFEGESNPADSSILYAIETRDNVKGTLVDSYGADAQIDLEEFINKADNQVD